MARNDLALRHSQELPTSRRGFMCLFVGLLVAAPRVAVAQGSKAVRRIGVLDFGAPDPPEFLWKQAEPLRNLGWVEGKNLQVERRYDNGRTELLQPLAEELVRAQVEIIVTWGTPATLAAKRATTTIPIIFGSAADPVLLGLVGSLARPGGNVTGFAWVVPELDAKRLSLLKELLPGLQRIAFLWETGHPYFKVARGQRERLCRSVGLEPVFADYASPGEIGDAIAFAARQRAQALVVSKDDFVWEHRSEIFDAAMKHGLPTMADDALMAREAGALIGYSHLQIEQDRILAEYVDRVLRGARPADLPVRQPTMFELVINLKIAQALGVSIPKELLLRADEVIQ